MDYNQDMKIQEPDNPDCSVYKCWKPCSNEEFQIISSIGESTQPPSETIVADAPRNIANMNYNNADADGKYKNGIIQVEPLVLPSMDCCILDENAVSIIKSPIKQFYCMTALDFVDLEHHCIESNPGEKTSFVSHSNKMPDVVDCCPVACSKDLKCTQKSSIKDYISDHLTDMSIDVCSRGASIDSLCNESRPTVDYSSESSSSSSSSSASSSSGLNNDDESGDISPPGVDVLPACPREDFSLGKSNVSTAVEDVVKDVSLAEMFNPVYIKKLHDRSDDCLSSSRKSTNKKITKSKSLKNDYRKNSCDTARSGKFFFAEKQEKMRKNKRKDRQKSSSVVNKNEFHWKSFDHFLSNDILSSVDFETDQNHSEESYEASSTESDNTVESVESKGQAAAIDQAWDGYQVPLYAAISDDSTEERLDASCLQGDWQNMTDDDYEAEYIDLENYTIYDHDQSLNGSDTDADELHYLIEESRNALHLTTMATVDFERTKESLSHREPMATCSTNIKCLKSLLEVSCQGNWTVNDIEQLSRLLNQWEELESRIHKLREPLTPVLLSPPNDETIIISFTQNDVPFDQIKSYSFDKELNLSRPRIELSSERDASSNNFKLKGDVDEKEDLNAALEHCHQMSVSGTNIQTVFFILLFCLLILYILIYTKCWSNVIDVQVHPHLSYILGPPPS